MKLSVVIPVYNEADTLAILVERVCKVPMDKEILLIDDGSTDGVIGWWQSWLLVRASKRTTTR
ncbi:MAG: hypothetical protein CM1200mP41_24760 [Gammaproteobacteria bacterium]|nr:MAG: hypothetical protein CM1200mP41_24760 [Gammaproteobacteria bacterium]